MLAQTHTLPYFDQIDAGKHIMYNATFFKMFFGEGKAFIASQ